MNIELSVFNLDSDSGMPLYMQLINNVKSAVTQGHLRPGDIIPSERELSDSLSIARGTVRKAFQQLYKEGILIRNQGAGTFVAPHLRQSLPLLESFSEMAEACGGQAQSELVGYLRRAALEEERQTLKIAEEKAEVVELTRLRKINGIAVAMQTTILPAPLLDKINELGESLYQYLEEKGKPILRASQYFRAVAADSKLAHHLNISEHEPLLLVVRTGYSHHDHPVEHTSTWCLDGYYDFTIELHCRGNN